MKHKPQEVEELEAEVEDRNSKKLASGNVTTNTAKTKKNINQHTHTHTRG